VELSAFADELGDRFDAFTKIDHVAQPGEVVQDDLLIRPGKNPNTAGARALFPRLDDPAKPLPANTDLLLVWGEGFDARRIPRGARTIFLDAWPKPEHRSADVFIPTSLQTERAGSYTNFQGVVSEFSPCFPRRDGVVDAEALFVALAAARVAAA
jgi:NADH-quinone oxidoreductase subunit G